MDIVESFEVKALQALSEVGATGLHFQLLPFANVTLYALEGKGLVEVGADSYVRITAAGTRSLAAQDPAVFAKLFGRVITGRTSTGYRSRRSK